MKRLIYLSLIILLASCQKGPIEIEREIETDVTLEDAFVHSAYFWFKEGTTAEEIDAFKASSERLREIETVRSFYAGPPADTDRPVIENSYDYAIVFLFKDLEAQEYYQQHPLHLELIEKHSEMWEKVMVTDVDLN